MERRVIEYANDEGERMVNILYIALSSNWDLSESNTIKTQS